MLYMLWSNICSGPQVRMQHEPYMNMLEDPDCIHAHHTHTHTHTTHTHLAIALIRASFRILSNPSDSFPSAIEKETWYGEPRLEPSKSLNFKSALLWCVCVCACACVHVRMQAVRTLRSSSVVRRTRTFRQITD